MNLSSVIITDNVIRALSSTFIYSLWQGLMLAAMAGLVVLTTRHSSSVKRYNLLVSLLAVFAGAIIITFIVQFVQVPGKQAMPVNYHLQPDMASDQWQGGVAIEHSTTGGALLAYLNGHAEMIVMIWFLIVCARCVQLLTGLHGLQRFRRSSFAAGADWEEKLEQLAASIGLRQKVMIVQSALAKVPMVIGHLKPVILIPASLLTAMQPAEIEAVLVHELAHIRRRDYLVNMLQHLMEIVFFFNPAVLWISSLIKAERENCCDDITLKQTGDKAAYIRALISCQEFQLQTPKMAIGLSGRRNLLGRVNRMVSSNNHSLSVVEKSLLTVCLVAAGITLAAFSRRQENKEVCAVNPQSVTSVTTITATEETTDQKATPVFTGSSNPFRIYKPVEVGDGTSCYIGDINDLKDYQTYLLKKEDILYQLNYIKGKLTSLQVDGKDISSPEWIFYKDKVQQLTGDHDAKAQLLFKQQKPDTVSEADIFDRAQQRLTNGIHRTGDAIDETGAALGRSLRELEAEKRPSSSPEEEDQELPLNIDLSIITPIRKTVTTGYNSDGYYKQPYKGSPRNQENYKTGLQKEYGQQSPKRKEWIKVEELIADMIHEGIVEKADDVRSFMISPQQMILNGCGVSSKIHQLLLNRYIKADVEMKWAIYYNFDTSTIKSITRNGINAGLAVFYKS